jgi:allantoicase
MKTSSGPRYLFPALFLVAVVLMVLPARALMNNRTNKSTAAAPQASTNPGQVGQWNSVLIPFKTVPLHISLLPNGKILYWGRDKVTVGANLEDVSGTSKTYVVDPQFFFNDPLGHTLTFTNGSTNLFCSGHSFLPDGRLLVTGGHEKDSAFPFTEGLGDRSVNIFDYTKANTSTDTPWTTLVNALNFGRWYPYNVTLANGDVAIIGGSYWTNRSTPNVQPLSAPNKNPEKYTFNPSGNGSITMYQEDENPPGNTDVYPLLHLLKDGRIMVTGVSSRLFVPDDPTMVGHFTGYPSGYFGPPPGSSQYNPSSALYDVANGKILVMGGAPGMGGQPIKEAVTADTSISGGWQSAGAMAFKRKFHTTTILPDGKVLVSGGTQCTGANYITCTEFPNPSDGAAVINPELWSPNSPTVWTTMAPSPSAIPRVYHSIALLLPDATVLIGAGGLPGAFGEPGAGTDTNSPQFRGYGHPDAEIFSPPYLFDAAGNPAVRPVITSVQSTKIGLGQAMQVGFTSSTAISSVVLIRNGSVTHGNNQDQRRIPLNFTTSGNTLNVTMPATGNICPPGPYMLFILNANGTPSVAKIISVSTTPVQLNGDTVWVEDALPTGAIPDGISEGWNWISSNPTPFSGALANQSNIVAGVHQHFFYGATDTLTINTGDKLFAYVYIDPANLPNEIMLQWNDGTWEHRAYWGANLIGWGTDGTNSRRYMGPLPPAGQWVRLEVPASSVGLEGRTLNGLAFSMWGGRATWDRAGKSSGTTSTAKNVAAAANGAVASASSIANTNFPAAAAINGDRTGTTWGTPTGGWNDGSQGDYSQDWVRVDFNGSKTINEIDVYTLRDNFASQTTDPTLTETFNTAPNTGLGITSYDVQYLSGQGWITIDCGNPTNPCGRVINNNKVRRQFIFSPVTTSAVRVAVHGSVPYTSATNYSRLVEIEAYSSIGSTNLALGRPATQSSTLYTTAGAAVDGNRDGNFANASVTHTNNTAQPWWQVDLGSVQNLDSVKLWNRTDCCGDRLSNFYVLVSDTPFNSTDLMMTLGQAGVSAYYTPGQAGPMLSVGVGRTGRYVRVQLAGTNFLSLAEVEVMSAVDLALGKSATQSSTLYTSAAAAVDGNHDGNFGNASVTHTSNTFQPWWQVDLGVSQNLDTIRLWNRTDCCGDRLSNFYVLVSDQPFASTDLNTTLMQSGVSSYYTAGQAGTMTAITVGRTGRYVRVQLSGTNFLSLAEVEISGSGQLNVAQSTSGAHATASSTFSASYPASSVIDGDRTGRNFGNGGGWNDATEGQFGSDWLQVNFAGTHSINEIDVFTLRDNFASQTGQPTLTDTFNTAPNTGQGITSFSVQYFNGSTWVDIPNGVVVFNNNVWRRFTFSPISTSAIRVMVRDAVVWTNSPNNYSRIVEVEAWEP